MGLIVKVCAITRVEDGLAALQAGADWLGFIRWPKSKRYRMTEEAVATLAALRRQAPRPFEAVGVYVDPTRELLDEEVPRLGLDRVQLHGDESPDFVKSLPWPVLKALRPRDAHVLRRLAETYAEFPLLVDAFDPEQPGGTGRTWDYAMLQELVAQRAVIVAGGLHPGNVGDIVKRLRPWGVDVASGVESEPGIKDPDLVKRFVEAARLA